MKLTKRGSCLPTPLVLYLDPRGAVLCSPDAETVLLAKVIKCGKFAENVVV